jgi:hypothetical protein
MFAWQILRIESRAYKDRSFTFFMAAFGTEMDFTKKLPFNA